MWNSNAKFEVDVWRDRCHLVALAVIYNVAAESIDVSDSSLKWLVRAGRKLVMIKNNM
jgi:hypothetical protein